MAGSSWIKMSGDLRTHPKVVRITSALKADKLRVIGALHAVWCVFDAHSEDGFLDGYTLDAIDDETFKGFAKAMVAVGWLEEDADGLRVPRFDSHNGVSAKRRAQETERKRTERGQKSEDETTVSGQVSASDADKLRSREEKRREERERPARGTRLPPDWALPDEWREYALQTRPDLDPDRTAEKFANYWHAKAGQGGTKLDWLATWRNWVLDEKSSAPAKSGARDGYVPGKGHSRVVL